MRFFESLFFFQVCMSMSLLNQIISESQSSSGTWSYTFMFEVKNMMKKLHQKDKMKVFSGLFDVILQDPVSELQQFKICQLICYIYNSYPEIFKDSLNTYKVSAEKASHTKKVDSELSRASFNLIKNL